ncbi:MAG: signal peptidase II, partial [Betaproteobacteria bacterium]|nr:signal peptidase II [Betaproteobacteria bacterium]
MSEPARHDTAALPSWVWLLLGLAVIALDQLSKWLVARELPLGASVPVTGFFNLVHIENPGAAFSFLAAQS